MLYSVASSSSSLSLWSGGSNLEFINYIHHRTGFDVVFVHNRIRSSNIIISQTSGQQYKPMICNFGLAHATGEAAPDGLVLLRDEQQQQQQQQQQQAASMEDKEGYAYMSPELIREKIPTQKSDVYAFGVLLLELLSGKAPLANSYHDKGSKIYVHTSIVETARATFEGGETEEKMLRWVDGRLGKVFPVKLAVNAMRVALMCVSENPSLRPDMGFVEGFISECIRKNNDVAYYNWNATFRI